jgi:hypothetical protein
VFVAALLATASVALAGGGVVPLVVLLAGLALPPVGFGGLGATRRAGGDTGRRRWFVLAVVVSPWLAALGYVAGRGIPEILLTAVLVVGYGSVGVVVGAAAHSIAARVTRSPA